MAMTFDQLVSALKPGDDGKLSVTGADLQSSAISDLFGACLKQGTLTLTGATATPNDERKSVTVSGTLESASFLQAATATTTNACFQLSEDGSVSVSMPIAIADDGWTLTSAFPTLTGGAFAALGFSDPVFTLSDPPGSAPPGGLRASLGYPADLPAVSAAAVPGLSLSCTVAVPTDGALKILKAILDAALENAPFSGPLSVVPSTYGKPPTDALYPQAELTTTAAGTAITVGPYSLTFGLSLACVLQEFGTDDTTLDKIGLVPVGALVLDATFTPSSGSVPGFQITAAFVDSKADELVLRGSGLTSASVGVDDLSGLLAGTSVSSTLTPGHGFDIDAGLTLQDVILVLALDGETPSFSSIEVSVAYVPPHAWEVADLVKFHDIDLTVGVARVAGSYSPFGSVAAGATLVCDSSAALDASINFPELSYTLGLASPSVDLTTLVTSLIGSGSTGIPTFTATEFKLTGDASDKSYAFAAKITENWTLIGTLELTEIDLSLSHASGSTTGSIAGTLTLGGVDIQVSAEYGGSGWTLSGSSAPGQSLTLNDVISDIASLFGATVPSGLPHADIDQLSVTFDTSDKTLSVQASISFPSASVNLAELPLVGNLTGGSDFQLALKTVTVSAKDEKDKKPTIDVSITVGIGASFTKTIDIPVSKGDGGGGGGDAAAAATRVGDGSAGAGVPPNGTWVDIQRSFGPVSIQKVGFGIGASGASIQMDASLSLAAFTVAVKGLGATVPLSTPVTPSFMIEGLSIAYDTPSLTIAGGLQKSGPDGTDFEGDLIVKAETLSLAAFAAYDSGSSTPKMFAYAVLNDPLGGPPVFFVTGLAAGLGVNKRLIPPALGKVKEFPLVAGAISTAEFGKDPDLTKVETALDQSIVDSNGEYWAAAGVAFTSFDLVKSFALVTVDFGTEFQVALLGESQLSVPKGATDPDVFAEMVLEALYTPSQGVFSVSAELTSASYVLDKNCHLTGGFAFYVWFDPSPQAGQFVVTLGGYNPSFPAPAYYPTVSRLGIDWQVSDALSIKGGQYMALTPSMIMAGGSFDATWHSGPIKAWFDLYFDVLIQWAPFHYLFDAGVDFGVEATVDLGFTTVTLSVHVGASLDIEGPPFAGSAEIHLSVLSFSIDFGDHTSPPSLTWEQFKEQFLSPTDGNDQVGAALVSSTGGSSDAVVKATVTDGMLIDLRAKKDGQGESFPVQYVVDKNKLAIGLATMIPVKKLSYNGTEETGDWNTDLAIGPLGLASFDNTFEVTLTNEGSVYSRATLDTTTLSGAAAALWGSKDNGSKLSGKALVDNTLMALSVAPELETPGVEQKIAIATLSGTNEKTFELDWQQNTAPTSDPFSGDDPMKELSTTIGSATVAAARDDVVASLITSGVAMTAPIDVTALEQTHGLGYLAPVTLSCLGETKAVGATR